MSTGNRQLSHDAATSGSRAWNLAVTALVFSALLYIFAPTMADPDLWGHVRFGGDIVAAGHVVEVDPYSYVTQGQRWINHEWLAEIAMYGAYAAGGTPGLVLLKLGLTLLAMVLMFWHMASQKVSPVLAGAMLIVIARPVDFHAFTVRPQLFTLLLFTVTLICLQRATVGSPRWLLALPPVFAVWANAHGGFLAGIAICGIWLATRTAELVIYHGTHGLLDRKLLGEAAAIGATLLATLLTPYGLDLWTFLLRTATVPRPEISEWQPIQLTSAIGGFYMALAGLLALGLLKSRDPKPAPLVVICIVVACLPLTAMRHLPLLAVCLPVLTGEHLQDVWTAARQRRARPTPPPPKPVMRTAAVGSVLALAVTLLAVTVSRPLNVDIEGQRMPAAAVQVLAASVDSANMAVYFDWGEYVIWHLGPRVQVSLDGRRETVYSEDVYAENASLMFGTGNWAQMLTNNPTDLVLTERGLQSDNLLRLSPGWDVAYEDDYCAVFARTGSPLLERIKRAPAPNLPADGQGLVFP